MNILISACLTGCRCRYDGKNKNRRDISILAQKYNLFPVCPEVDGGLPVPREPSEISGDRVMNKKGEDVTDAFVRGALAALECARANNCRAAILKARSPSCGRDEIYDGTFTSTLILGDGILVRMLKEEGIAVYTEDEIYMLLASQDSFDV